MLWTSKFFIRAAALVSEELRQMEKHREHLPLLLTTDPMVKVYGFKLKDIVKIYRRNGDIVFRKVVENENNKKN